MSGSSVNMGETMSIGADPNADTLAILVEAHSATAVIAVALLRLREKRGDGSNVMEHATICGALSGVLGVEGSGAGSRGRWHWNQHRATHLTQTSHRERDAGINSA